VLCVARLLPHKGIDVLLAAADPSRQLVFCGPGPEAMCARIRAAGAICLPPRPRHELLALYHACDAFALPSHNEGFPVVVQEALACGLPVLTTDSDAYAAYRGTPGLHFCAPDPVVVAAQLAAILAAPPPAAAGLAADPRSARDAWLRELLASVQPPPAPASVGRS
jgi:glycosyltransferase involved in cell wall biosynthesis